MLRILAVALFFLMNSLSSLAGDYRHVVLFKFKDSAEKAEIAKLEKAFNALEEKIEEIKDFEWGTNVSPEGHDKGFTHCFLVTFEDKSGLEAYLPHPAHKDFVAKLKPLMEDVLVVDYVAK